MLKSAYRSFAKECYLIIELMRQFYDEQRVFRVTGETGRTEYTPFSAAQLRAVPGGEIGGVQLGDHEPVFDITVSAVSYTHLRTRRRKSATRWASLRLPTPTRPWRRWT